MILSSSSKIPDTNIACCAMFLKRKKCSYIFKSYVTRVDLLIKLLIIIKILIIKFSFFVKRREGRSAACAVMIINYSHPIFLLLILY